MNDCIDLLEETSDVPPLLALHESRVPRWNRLTERFRTSFDLARRLLSGIGHQLGTGAADTFVFLLDMNNVFERYVHAALQACFRVCVDFRKHIGTLLKVERGGIAQIPDFVWETAGKLWIGDAKYKHLTSHLLAPLSILGAERQEDRDEGTEPVAGNSVLDPGDIRQLTVYAELVRLATAVSADLMLLYPFVGAGPKILKASAVKAWNGSLLWLTPVRVQGIQGIDDALPPAFARHLARAGATSGPALE